MSIAAPEAPAPALPFAFFEPRVVRTRRLGPTMVRITLGGAQLRDFAGGGRDQSFSLFLPHPGQEVPLVPTAAGADWFARWRAMDPAVRAVMRSYTVRAQRFEPAEIDIDFALHGDTGPASRWAAAARPGDRVTLYGPLCADNKSVGFRPPPDTDWVLISADETALPAAAAILEWLPQGMPVRAWIEVPDAADIQPLPTAASADVRWLVRGRAAARPGDLVLDAVRPAPLPAGRPYAWIAGESATVRALRRHLVTERGLDRGRVKFAGYWRLGASEEQIVEQALAGTAPAGGS